MNWIEDSNHTFAWMNGSECIARVIPPNHEQSPVAFSNDVWSYVVKDPLSEASPGDYGIRSTKEECMHTVEQWYGT